MLKVSGSDLNSQWFIGNAPVAPDSVANEFNRTSQASREFHAGALAVEARVRPSADPSSSCRRRRNAKSSIIVSAPHAQSPALAIAPTKGTTMRSSHCGEIGRPAQARNGNPKYAGSGCAGERVEAQAAMAPIADDGHENCVRRAAAPPRSIAAVSVSRSKGRYSAIRLPARESRQHRDALARRRRERCRMRPARSRRGAPRAIVYVALLSSKGDGATRICRFGPLLPT